MARRLIAAAVVCAAVASVAAQRAVAPVADARLETLQAYPDLIVVNGRIQTMDPARTTAGAMAVRGGRVLALGTTADIQALA
jgi:hypothetical protein